MCYLAHQHRAAPEEGASARPADAPSVRPRWVGVAVASIVGAVALAALLAPALPPAAADEATSVGAPPVAGKEALTPVADRTALPADDGVPSSDVVLAGKRECSSGF